MSSDMHVPYMFGQLIALFQYFLNSFTMFWILYAC